MCDEPISALDVSIQAQVINLLEELQEQFGLTYLFIAHDLSVVRHISDRVAVMYAGRIIEDANVRDLFNKPSHPYTQALMASVPQMDRTDRLFAIEGQPPALYALPEGCRFADRCPHVRDICRREYPPKIDIDTDHMTHCWMFDSAWKDQPEESASSQQAVE